MWVEDGLRPQLESIDESGVPFALGVSPPIVIGTFKRRTPQANGAAFYPVLTFHKLGTMGP